LEITPANKHLQEIIPQFMPESEFSNSDIDIKNKRKNQFKNEIIIKQKKNLNLKMPNSP